MAAVQDQWPSRSSILRFNLDAISLSGSLNSFKDPQLVLKTQHGPPPRVPYTGNRSRAHVTRHVLMVHVKDKANELETLDLGAFIPPASTSASDIHSCVEYLSTDHSLIFKYAKGGPGNACTLRVKFQEASDLGTVVAELRALRISIAMHPSPESSSMTMKSSSGGFLASQSQSSSPLLVRSSSQEYHSASPPLIASQGAQGQQISYTPATSQGLPSHLFRQRSSQHSNYPPTWSSISPVNQAPRPATTIGIPNTLGEGLYRVSKVVSAPGHRTWQRRSSRLAEGHRPGAYTFSKHFDRTLDGSDIAKLTRHILRQDEDSHEMLSQESSEDRQVTNATQLAEEHSLSSIDYPMAAGIHGPSTMQQQRTLEYPQRTTRQSTPRHEPRRTASQNSARSEYISQELSRTHPEYLRSSPGGAVSSPPIRGPAHTTVTHTPRGPANTQPRFGESAPDQLHQFVRSYHEGLSKATRIWDELMAKGESETKSVDDDTQASMIFARYAETFATRLDDLAAVTERKMRGARGGGAT